jgi:poly(hydroxyalkanoate) granule-associated protein
MAEEVIKAGNGASAPHVPVKKAARKPSKKVEENKMDETQAPEAVVAEVQKTTEATVADVQETVAAAPEAASEVVAQAQETVEETKAPATGINKIVKDASAQVERLPGSKQVREVVTKVADQVGSNETTQKAVRRVKDGVQQATDQVKQGAQDLEKNPLVVAAHKVLLAGIGAAALAQEEIEDFINRLVERGSIAEADGRRMAKDVLDQRRKQMERASERAQEVATEMRSSMAEGPKKIADDLEQRIESVLARMNIPTKEEVETLTAKITALTHKVDELKKTE